jgi:hypothetical protein
MGLCMLLKISEFGYFALAIAALVQVRWSSLAGVWVDLASWDALGVVMAITFHIALAGLVVRGLVGAVRQAAKLMEVRHASV